MGALRSPVKNFLISLAKVICLGDTRGSLTQGSPAKGGKGGREERGGKEERRGEGGKGRGEGGEGRREGRRKGEGREGEEGS